MSSLTIIPRSKLTWEIYLFVAESVQADAINIVMKYRTSKLTLNWHSLSIHVIHDVCEAIKANIFGSVVNRHTTKSVLQL